MAQFTIKQFYYYTHRKLWAQLNLKHKPTLAVNLLNYYKIVNVALTVTKRVSFHAHSGFMVLLVVLLVGTPISSRATS